MKFNLESPANNDGKDLPGVEAQNKEKINELDKKFNTGDDHVQSDYLDEMGKWMMLRKEGKEKQFGRVVITGGTEGIGREISLEFADRHNSVAICARSQEKLDDIKAMHPYFIPKILAEKVDISNRHEGKKFIKEIVNEFGGLDSLILNAAALDFNFKFSGLSEEEIKKQMFKTNVIGNVALIRESKEALKKSKGTIAFITTRFGIVENLETASVVSSNSESAKEDIGNYIENKRMMRKYLDDFISDSNNDGIFVFSIVPGTVNSKANKALIEFGTSEMSTAKITEKRKGKERNPRLIGIISAKMIATRKKFNPNTSSYDIDIKNGEIVEISNAVIEFEEEKRVKRSEKSLDDFRYGYYGRAGFYLDRESLDKMDDRKVFDTYEIMSRFSFNYLKKLPQDQKVTDREDFFVNFMKEFFGEDLSHLTIGDIVRMVESIKTDIKNGLVRITRDDLWLRSGARKE